MLGLRDDVFDCPHGKIDYDPAGGKENPFFRDALDYPGRKECLMRFFFSLASADRPTDDSDELYGACHEH